MVFEEGRVYQRAALHDEWGGQRYGGIATPAAQPLVFLVSGEEGSSFGYDDEELADGTLLYFGEGQVGDQSFSGGNRAIRDHGSAGEELHVFRKVRDGFIRYLGQYDCAGYEIREGIRDRNGDPRQAIVFQLVPHSQLAADEETPLPDDDGSAGLAALRATALEAPLEGVSAVDASHHVYKRSRAVRRYVLARANGRCEGCEQPAPFLRPTGEPYLEPHHTRRVSDAGPDHPRYVIALCPTCHSRVHYGADGSDYNQALEGKLAVIEAGLASAVA